MITAALAGLGLGLSLIVAIGAQNAFVLRQGLLRQHVLLVVVICSLSDIVLIALGIAGAGAVFTAAPWLVEVVRWAGAAFLLVYGLLAARRAVRPRALAAADPAASGASTVAIASTCLALTWLNPHVYLDTLVLLGSVGSTHGDYRWAFGVGAAIASVLWFTLLGFGARLLAPVFAKPMAWRVLDGIIAVVMAGLAVMLVVAR
ncbi:LysE/ArgO family amino acid transporter [soil metagenome]